MKGVPSLPILEESTVKFCWDPPVFLEVTPEGQLEPGIQKPEGLVKMSFL